MPFPTVAATTNANAQAAFQSACSAAGLQLSTLSGLSQVQLALANLLDYDPTTSDVPAGNIVPGTFAANTASPTGAFTFAGALTAGAASFTTIAGSGNLTVGASTFVVTAATGAVSAQGGVCGLKGTPSAWGTAFFSALESSAAGFGQGAVFIQTNAQGEVGLVSNAFLNSAAAWKAINGAGAGKAMKASVNTTANTFVVSYAASLTAADTITWTDALTVSPTQATFATPLAIAGALTGVTTAAISGNVTGNTNKWGFTASSGAIGIGALPTATSVLHVVGLPTSAAGLAAGDVWANLGILTVV